MSVIGNSVLIIYEKNKEAKFLAKILKDSNLRVNVTSNGYSGLEYMSFERYDIVFVSIDIPLLKINDFLPRLRKVQPYVKIILIGDMDKIDKSWDEKYNIFDLVKNDFVQEDLDLIIKKIRTALEVSSYKIIGSSQKMKMYFGMLEKIMKSSVTVMIYGESGTGKELTARALHEGGPRAGKPFITVNCATIPENLLESELFGHEKGSFTGAVQRRIGKFEAANKGAIFLDEIGELSPVIQSKFLRVLEEQSFERVGGNETVKVDVRIISATNRNLREMVSRNLFREDLYYRLNAISVHVPALRERKEDIPELVNYFMQKYLPKTGKNTPMILNNDTLEIFKNYSWPGNIRELENAVMRAMVLSENLEIDIKDLPEEIIRNLSMGSNNKENTEESGVLKKVCSLMDIEKEAIKKALVECNYNATLAARILDIGRMTFYRKAKLYSIKLRKEIE